MNNFTGVESLWRVRDPGLDDRIASRSHYLDSLSGVEREAITRPLRNAPSEHVWECPRRVFESLREAGIDYDAVTDALRRERPEVRRLFA